MKPTWKEPKNVPNLANRKSDIYLWFTHTNNFLRKTLDNFYDCDFSLLEQDLRCSIRFNDICRATFQFFFFFFGLIIIIDLYFWSQGLSSIHRLFDFFFSLLIFGFLFLCFVCFFFSVHAFYTLYCSFLYVSTLSKVMYFISFDFAWN